MHEDVDEDEEEIVLDRQTLINSDQSASNFGVNRFNIKVYDDPIKVSQAKGILLAATCVAMVRHHY